MKRTRISKNAALAAVCEPELELTQLKVSRRTVLSGLVAGVTSVGCAGLVESSEDASGSTDTSSPTDGNPAAASATGSDAPSVLDAVPDQGQEAAPASGPRPTSDESEATQAQASDSERASQETTADEADVPASETDTEMVEIEGDGSGQVEITQDELTEAPPELPDEPVAAAKTAADRVILGASGVEVSRMAMGSGTRGYNYSSDQVKLGDQFGQLLIDAYDEGVTFFECADTYGSHFLAAEAAKQIGRDKVQLLTKSHAETREEMEADLERFLEELQTDYIDIVLLHNRTSATWTEDYADCMEVLADAKQTGKIRAHGISCHSIAATDLASRTDWVDVNLIRINPFGLHMDADPDTVIEAIDRAKAANHGVIGMKILGQGEAVDRLDKAIEHAVRLDGLDAFTIGFTSRAQMDEVTTKIAAVTPV
jgi:aryl-alcohol dehydrogenase-like predicted oxidoreductase